MKMEDLPKNQHLFCPKRGRKNVSPGVSGKLSKIAATPDISSGTPHAYTS